jgi:membrane protein DedA with SNARE-associated domain
LLVLLLYMAVAAFAWFSPEGFLHVELAVLTVLVIVVAAFVRILYVQRRAQRARSRSSSVVVPIRD